MTAPRKVLLAEQMRAVDAKTIDLGIPGVILMENAAARATDFLAEEFAPLHQQRIVVFCGKGNNGGDGLAVARQLLTRVQPKTLDVLLACAPEELAGDTAANFQMLQASGRKVAFEIEPRMYTATLIVDALLGTGLTGPARGKALRWIREINSNFPLARVFAVDVPSGMPSDSGDADGEIARADATITFTALRHCHVLAPNCRKIGKLRIAPIGSPACLYQGNAAINLACVESAVFRELLAPRDPGGNKGSYGHVLVIAGSRGKTGAAAMSGLTALRAGAGLVTVASAGSAIPVIAAHAPELMTELLPETSGGAVAECALSEVEKLIEKRSIVALGPGLGTDDETATLVRSLFQHCKKPMVVDADALNTLASGDWPHASGFRVLTPHPGEMARLTNTTVKDVQSNRVGVARAFAVKRELVVVLKGERTLIAFPDGQVWVNPTGSPSMATGGTGDILTGLISGMLAQHPDHTAEAIACAVYLHGRMGELGAMKIGEQALIATDLLQFLPDAMREAWNAKKGLYDPDFV